MAPSLMDGISIMGQVMYVLLIGFYLGVIIIVIYILTLADAESTGLNGRLSMCLLVHAPRQLSKTLLKFLGPTLFKKCSSTYDYAVNERNPIMQVVYLVIINTSFLCWLIFGVPLLPNSMVSYYHKYIAYLGVAACNFSFYTACNKGPGVIVEGNLRCFAHQPFDGALYVEGYGCRTCQIKKVIRREKMIIYHEPKNQKNCRIRILALLLSSFRFSVDVISQSSLSTKSMLLKNTPKYILFTILLI